MKKLLLLFLITMSMFGCSHQEPEINTQEDLSTFFLNMSQTTQEKFFKIKTIPDLNQFLYKHNIHLDKIVESRNSCTGGMCSMKDDMKDKDLWSYFNLPEKSWTPITSNIITNIINQYKINISGSGVIFCSGGPACVILDGTMLELQDDSRKKYYLYGLNMPHFCEAGNPIPIITQYNGSIMASVDPCQKYNAAMQYFLLKSAMFGAIPLITNLDLSAPPFLPGAYWARYGIEGYGKPDPNSGSDAKYELDHAACHGVN